MPEGPEIRLAADQIASVLVGQTIVHAYFAFPHLGQYGKKLKGHAVNAVDTRGKAMLTRFDNGLTLYSHNQLYGRWFTAPRGCPNNTRRALRVALHTATHSALLYSATDVEILTPQQVGDHPFLSRIGPDILHQDTAPARIAARLEHPRFRRRAVGSLYLDQSFLAGIGNYLRSEILFTARVHYLDKPAALDKSARNRLARSTTTISWRSYRTRGVTVTQKLARSLRRKGLSYEQYRFWVYGREGFPCYVCGTPIHKNSISGRGLYFCPACQVPRK